MKPTVDLSQYDNSWYQPGSKLKRLLWYVCNFILFKSYWFQVSALKVFILRLFGAKVGKRVVIKPNVNIKYPWFLKIGDNTWVGEGVWLDCLTVVDIGNNVCISQGALILNGNHDYKKSTFDLIVKPIVIEDGAWIGAKCTVTQGITIGYHSVLTAGSVASRSLEPYAIYKGVPAVKIKERQINF
ncbi:MAG: WcaF family extracellular polysaccharide biosynthesis acetyltransferase [Bacteroidota bacterium]